MNTLQNLVWNAHQALQILSQLLRYAVTFLLALDRLLREYIDEYYHVARPHQGLDGDTPVLKIKPELPAEPTKLISTPVVGGLHHTYERVAP